MPEDARTFFNALEQLIERSGAIANAQTTEEMAEVNLFAFSNHWGQ